MRLIPTIPTVPIRLNPCTIDGDVITTGIFTGFGKSVGRVIWGGFWHCLERRTSVLVIEECIRVLGPSYNSQKKTSFVQDSRISYWLQLVWPRSPLLLYGFQSNLVLLECYFQGESSTIVTKDKDHSLWKMLAITEIAPLRSIWRYW